VGVGFVRVLDAYLYPNIVLAQNKRKLTSHRLLIQRTQMSSQAFRIELNSLSRSSMISPSHDDQNHMVTRWKSIVLRIGRAGKDLGVLGKSVSQRTMGRTYPVVGKASPDPRYLINFRADPGRWASTGLVDSHPTSANKFALVTEICVTG